MLLSRTRIHSLLYYIYIVCSIFHYIVLKSIVVKHTSYCSIIVVLVQCILAVFSLSSVPPLQVIRPAIAQERGPHCIVSFPFVSHERTVPAMRSCTPTLFVPALRCLFRLVAAKMNGFAFRIYLFVLHLHFT